MLNAYIFIINLISLYYCSEIYHIINLFYIGAYLMDLAERLYNNEVEDWQRSVIAVCFALAYFAAFLRVLGRI